MSLRARILLLVLLATLMPAVVIGTYDLKQRDDMIDEAKLDLGSLAVYAVDTFGHAAGDHVLTEVARLLTQHIRGSDMVCRYGGEEFLLILPDATLDSARQRAENIRTLVKNLDLRFHDQPLGTITASLGIASFPVHAAGTDALIQAADEALYEAKSTGRNRVSVSSAKCPVSAATMEIT